MPQGKRTSTSKAAEAKALADIGYQGTEIERHGAAGTHGRRHNQMAATAGVRSLSATEAFRQYRTDAKRKMQAASIKLSQKALQQIENKVDKASALKGAMVFAILRDKRAARRRRTDRDHGERHTA